MSTVLPAPARQPRRSFLRNFSPSARFSLSVGVNRYSDRPLSSCVVDAVDMSALLRDQGRFTATVLQDATKAAIESSLADFIASLIGGCLVVIFLSGHGLEHDGCHYFVPVDGITTSTADVRRTCVALNDVLKKLDDKLASGVVVVLMDTCRSSRTPSPFKTRGSADDISDFSLSPHATDVDRRRSATEFIIGFAANPGQPALEVSGMRNGYYTAALLACLRDLGHTTDVSRIMKEVTSMVLHATGGAQRPWTHGCDTVSELRLFPPVASHPPHPRVAIPPVHPRTAADMGVFHPLPAPAPFSHPTAPPLDDADFDDDDGVDGISDDDESTGVSAAASTSEDDSGNTSSNTFTRVRSQRINVYGIHSVGGCVRGLAVSQDAVYFAVSIAAPAKHEVHVHTVADGALCYVLGAAEGYHPGEFHHPEQLCFHPSSNALLVADSFNKRVQEFVIDGTFDRYIGEGMDGVCRALAVSADVIAVGKTSSSCVDGPANHNRVVLYEYSSGRLMRQFGEIGLCFGLQFTADGRYVIAAHCGAKVSMLSVFTMDGHHVADVGSGLLRQPYSVAVRGSQWFVADYCFSGIFCFDTTPMFAKGARGKKCRSGSHVTVLTNPAACDNDGDADTQHPVAVACVPGSSDLWLLNERDELVHVLRV